MGVQNPMVVSTEAGDVFCVVLLGVGCDVFLLAHLMWCVRVCNDVVSKYGWVQYKVLRVYNSCTLDVLSTQINNLSFL